MSDDGRGAAASERVPAPAGFELRVEPHRETIRVTPVGELDIASATELGREVEQLVGSGFGQVLIDLRELTFIDSMGLRLLLRLNASARCDGWRLSLIQGPEAVSRMFALTATLDRLPFESPGLPLAAQPG
jgi:anti-anti-sigma factor